MAPDLALDLEASGLAGIADFDAPLRAGERDADFVAAPFDAAPLDAAPDFDAVPDFDAAPDFDAMPDLDAVLDFDAAPFAPAAFEPALFKAAPILDAPFAAALTPLVSVSFTAAFVLPAPAFVAFLLLAPAPFASGADFFVLLDAPPEPIPDLRDFVVLSAITRLLPAFA